MPSRDERPLVPAAWQRQDAALLPLWWERLCAESGAQVAARYAHGLFAADRRRPIAQWHNPALDSALLVAPETSPEWPVQRFGVFYAPPGSGFVKVNTEPHEWYPLTPRVSPTEDEAFAAAIVSAEAFLQVEMNFV